MADTTSQLKRKRESAIGSQTKAKKLRKEADAEQDARAAEETVDTAPVVKHTPNAPKTRTPIDKSKPRLRKPQTNGVPVETPSSSTPKSKPSAQSDGGSAVSVETPVKQSKKQRKQEQIDNNSGQPDGKDVQGEEVEAQPKSQANNAEKAAKNKAKKERKALTKAQTSDPTKSKKKHGPPAKWFVSPAIGGWFLPKDPIFSLKEDHVFIASPKAVLAYSTETSLLARTLPISTPGVFVTAFALSSVKPNQIYVADSSELITLWDWAEGEKLGRWQVGAMVKDMAVIARPGSDEDLVYCYEAGKNGQNHVNVHALRIKGETELRQVLESSSRITSLQVLLQGKYLIVSTTDTISFGKRLKASKTAVKDFNVSIFTRSECDISANFRHSMSGAKSSSTNTSPHAALTSVNQKR